ncbi:MAG: sialate O-acetylesterase [Eubacteriales bacterium]
MCAYGGSPCFAGGTPRKTRADEEYAEDAIADYDLHPKAMLWYQGEAEGFENSAETYLDRFSVFLDSLRASLNQPELPVITFQLNRQFCESDLALDRQWGIVRQAQRDAMYQLKKCLHVAAQDVAMFDFIHNGAGGNLTLGERAAKCALSNLYGKQRDWKAPEVTSTNCAGHAGTAL